MERTVLDCVVGALDDLSSDDFTRFKRKLCETKKIRYGQIESASKVDVAQKIVTVFTKAGAVGQTARVLRGIGLNEEAEALEEEGVGVPASGGRNEPAAEKRWTPTNTENVQHFVDRHMSDLINRVTMVPPILDQLLQRGIIQQEMYHSIHSVNSSCEQMRMLLLKVIMPGGNRAKDELCRILEKEQKFLMEELKGN